MNREAIKEYLIKRRENVLTGNINCIPNPFTRFREYWPGIEQLYYVVSGATKSSKTQLSNFLFLITPIIHWIEHPNQIKPKIFYFPLEESELNITLRFQSYVIYLISGIVISPTDLKSTDERKVLPAEILEIMDTDEFIKYTNAFEECVVFCEERNPYGIYKRVMDYVETHGKIIYENITVEYKDEFGKTQTKEIQKVKEYIPDNPNEWVFNIVDHVGLLTPEKGTSLKDAIESLSSKEITLRNNFGVVGVVIQQQNTETTNLTAFKANKIRPTKDGLKDSKRTGEDCSMLIGITNPMSFELPEYLKYDITKLQDNFRVVEIVLAREGRANALCPLYFDGRINSFIELPLPDQMEKAYQWVFTQRKNKLFLMFKKLFKKWQ